MTQVRRAKSGVIVINHSRTYDWGNDPMLLALYGTYRKWWRRFRGTEAGPGSAKEGT